MQRFNTYILTFKPLIYAILMIALIEFTIAIYNPDFLFGVYKNNMFKVNTLFKENLSLHKLSYKLADKELYRSKIIIVGDSTAEYGIAPQHFMNELKNSTYNVAVGGGFNPNFMLKILEHIIQNGIVETVVISFYPFHSARDKHEILDHVNDFYLASTSKFFQIPSSIYKNSFLDCIFNRHCHKQPLARDYVMQANGNVHLKELLNKSRGHIPILNSNKQDNQQLCKNDDKNLQNLTSDYFVEIYTPLLQYLTAKNINIIFSPSPYQCAMPNSKHIILEMINKLKISYPNVVFSFDQLYLSDPKYFIDYTHLNQEGALHYSRIIGETIKKNFYTN